VSFARRKSFICLYTEGWLHCVSVVFSVKRETVLQFVMLEEQGG